MPGKRSERIIGTYEGQKHGPLFICIGGMHGNEPAGVIALEYILELLRIEPIKNPSFVYHGKLLALIGNVTAFDAEQRFIDKDLNRQFLDDKVAYLLQNPEKAQNSEEHELIELVTLIKQEINNYKPTEIFFIDIHTTSSIGGFFSICHSDKKTIEIARSLHAPIVLGMLDNLKGTSLHYFNEQNLGIKTTALTFESGQHKEPDAINRAIAGIICFMREMGLVSPEDVENHHEDKLIKSAASLPNVTRLVERYEKEDGDGFMMIAGYRNFQIVTEGEQIAVDNHGPIKVKENGRILMPLYQSKGEDGFFIIKDLEI